MTEITIDLIKKLRNQTGVSIMQCKKALQESGGDLEKAKITLTKKSGEIAAKKEGRDLKAGIIIAKYNIILELACETDFVANNNEYKNLANNVIDIILENDLKINNVKNDEKILDILSKAIQKFGERIEVVRFDKFNNNTASYIHINNSVGAIIEFSDKINESLGRDIAMHITAQKPKYLKKENIDSLEIEKAKDTLKEEVKDKPENMQEKILEGKLNAYFKERVLLTQTFIKDSSKTIEKLLSENNVGIIRFVRYGVGEE
ncbi:MAG: translation elongation factor Ts [Candidatus Pacebacteria bacterium]|nr:translation elongation factor Ts [Candidatus Paceibacterota bacterium]